MAKFKDIHGLFEYVKKQRFMMDYSDVNPNGGFNHRFSSQHLGDKVMELTQDDKVVVADALDEFIEDCIVTRDRIRAGEI